MAPKRWKKAFQNQLVNYGPRSDTTSLRKQCTQIMCWRSAVSLVKGSSGRKMSLYALEKQSTHDQDDNHSLGSWQVCDKVQGNVGAWVRGNG